MHKSKYFKSELEKKCTFTKSPFMNAYRLNLLMCLLVCVFNLGAQSLYNSQFKEEPMLHPDFLVAGDTVAIVAPAGILINKTQQIENAKALMQSWGLNVLSAPHLFSKANHFAGSDEERTADMQWALDHPKVKAIWCARGGYGVTRIIDDLDFTLFLNKPKWLIGYSDITVLHAHLNKLRVASIHGMMGVNLDRESAELDVSKATFKKALLGENLKYKFAKNTNNKGTEAKGELIGGNLTLLQHLLGSESQPNTKDKLIFIEEIGEYKYHIDRLMQSLKRAGFFELCKGLVVGNFTNIKSNNPEWGCSIESLILDVVKNYEFPVFFGFDAGHEIKNQALILGATVSLETFGDSVELKINH